MQYWSKKVADCKCLMTCKSILELVSNDVSTAVTAMLDPFFDDMTGLMGAIAFWLPGLVILLQMHSKQAGIPKRHAKRVGC